MARWYRCGFLIGQYANECSYQSEHRSNSKANREDALAAIRKRYGRHTANIAEIRWTMLDTCMG